METLDDITWPCDYLVSAVEEKLPLKFTMTEKDFAWCLAADDLLVYPKAYGHKELWTLGAHAYLKELANHAFAFIWKYQTKANTLKSKLLRTESLPKFISYSGHSRTLTIFREALGYHSAVKPVVSSALMVEYLKVGD